MFFTDKDFDDLLSKPRDFETKSYYRETPKKAKHEEEKKIFKPTPIISPVYGILDKNYHKEDIVSRNEVVTTPKIEEGKTIDSVRNKAYGTLEDELENTLFGKNSVLFKE